MLLLELLLLLVLLLLCLLHLRMRLRCALFRAGPWQGRSSFRTFEEQIEGTTQWRLRTWTHLGRRARIEKLVL